MPCVDGVDEVSGGVIDCGFGDEFLVADGDLWVDPAFLAHADFAQAILLFCLEVQRGQSYNTSATPGPRAPVTCFQQAVARRVR